MINSLHDEVLGNINSVIEYCNTGIIGYNIHSIDDLGLDDIEHIFKNGKTLDEIQSGVCEYIDIYGYSWSIELILEIIPRRILDENFYFNYDKPYIADNNLLSITNYSYFTEAMALDYLQREQSNYRYFAHIGGTHFLNLPDEVVEKEIKKKKLLGIWE